MSTTDRFRTAVEERDLDAVTDLFSAQIRFFSPVKFTPFEGLPMVRGLFGVLLRTFEEFRYVGELDGSAQTSAEQDPEPAHLLMFRAKIAGKEVHGIDLLQFDDRGLIDEFTVMVRPMSGLAALSDAVLAGLRADGLVPDAAELG
ncbi:nuclear transport factor 2-like protein [Parasphingorhabdus pacifica]